MVPVAVYELHFPFPAFNTQRVFLLPNRVLSPCVCLFVGVRLFVDLAGRPSGRGHSCSQTHTKSFPLKEMGRRKEGVGEASEIPWEGLK